MCNIASWSSHVALERALALVPIELQEAGGPSCFAVALQGDPLPRSMGEGGMCISWKNWAVEKSLGSAWMSRTPLLPPPPHSGPKSTLLLFQGGEGPRNPGSHPLGRASQESWHCFLIPVLCPHLATPGIASGPPTHPQTPFS